MYTSGTIQYDAKRAEKVRKESYGSCVCTHEYNMRFQSIVKMLRIIHLVQSTMWSHFHNLCVKNCVCLAVPVKPRVETRGKILDLNLTPGPEPRAWSKNHNQASVTVLW